MRLGKDIIGKWIVTIDEGRQMGKVKDLLLDPELTQLNGIYLERKGVFRRKIIYIPRESVVVYGVDAVLIESAEAVTESRTNPIDDWVRLSDITGRQIDTPGGTKLATLGDMILNSEGKITGFSLAKVSVTGPIADNRAIARPAISDTGNADGTMTIDLPMAELLGMPTEHSVFVSPASTTNFDSDSFKKDDDDVDIDEEEVADDLLTPPESLDIAK
jgi:uncharacterized protein YrrD